MTTHIELISGAELDYLAGIVKYFGGEYPRSGDDMIDIRHDQCWVVVDGQPGFVYQPSRSWSDALELLEQHIISLSSDDLGKHFFAITRNGTRCIGRSQCEAITRAYVAMRLGKELCFSDYTLQLAASIRLALRPLPSRMQRKH